MIHPLRIQSLNRKPARQGRYILYWMQASQRTECNHALEYAIRQANERRLPLIVLFVLLDHYPEANLRHYAFMLEGLREVRQDLEDGGIPFILKQGQGPSPAGEVIQLGGDAAMVVTDRGYLRHQKAWRHHVANHTPCLVAEVETDAVVPVEAVSSKAAYTAATIRPRIEGLLPDFMIGLSSTPVDHRHPDLTLCGRFTHDSGFPAADDLRVNRSVQPVTTFTGGTRQAREHLESFISLHLKDYADRRSDPGTDISSRLSPYLHFGQISPLYIALRIRQAEGVPEKAKAAYLEELIVRRELSLNFVHYEERYDDFDVLPAWAITTLARHQSDLRPYQYTCDYLERAETHDPYWNAAQREMAVAGKMHPYMRMYWGKKILEWSPTPREAWRTALHLNNRYELDGRDPNSYAGIAWCFGKHDRPWAERPIFGMVRYMNSAGLERKFDIKRYVERVNRL